MAKTGYPTKEEVESVGRQLKMIRMKLQNPSMRRDFLRKMIHVWGLKR